MTELSVDIVGVSSFQKGIAAAVIELEDLDEAKKRAAEMSIRAAEKYTPKQSGQLVRSLRANQIFPGSMTSTVAYANAHHWGWAKMNIRSNLFLVRGAREAESKWLQYFEEEIDDSLDHAATKGSK